MRNPLCLICINYNAFWCFGRWNAAGCWLPLRWARDDFARSARCRSPAARGCRPLLSRRCSLASRFSPLQWSPLSITARRSSGCKLHGNLTAPRSTSSRDSPNLRPDSTPKEAPHSRWRPRDLDLKCSPTRRNGRRPSRCCSSRTRMTRAMWARASGRFWLNCFHWSTRSWYRPPSLWSSSEIFQKLVIFESRC